MEHETVVVASAAAAGALVGLLVAVKVPTFTALVGIAGVCTLTGAIAGFGTQAAVKSLATKPVVPEKA